MNYLCEATNLGTGKRLLFDFGNKINMTFQCRKRENLTVRYGPFRNFLPFSPRLTEQQRDGEAFLAPKNLVSCRYFEAEGAEEGDFTFQIVSRPQDDVSEFCSDDRVYNEIFRISKNTIQACTIPHTEGCVTIHLQSEQAQQWVKKWHGKTTDFVIFDGARRDREVWAGDLLPEIRSAYCLFRDTELIENTLNVILDQTRENGYIPASSITSQNFPEYNFWFVVAVHEYLMMSGRREYFECIAEKLERIVGYNLSILEETGLICSAQGKNWAWTTARKGRLTSANCIAAHSMNLSARLFAASNRPLSKRCLSAFSRIRDLINRSAFDETAHLYFDDVERTDGRYSLDANCFAIISGIAPEAETREILNGMKEKFHTAYGSLLFSPKEAGDGQNWVHNDNVWPFLVCWEVEARLKCGDFSGADELLRATFGTMIEHGADTCWEIIDGESGGFLERRLLEIPDADTWNSAAHGWGAGVPYLIDTYFAGVRPTAWGYSECEWNPRLEFFASFSVEIPTPYGKISISYRRAQATLRLEIPSGVRMVNRCERLFEADGRPVGGGTILPGGEYVYRGFSAEEQG